MKRNVQAKRVHMMGLQTQKEITMFFDKDITLPILGRGSNYASGSGSGRY